MLGKIFRIVRKTVQLPVAVVKDVATLGLEKSMTGKTFTTKKLDEIEEELDEE